MTPDEATDLATRLCLAWPKAAPATEWEPAIADLDAGAAGTVYARLKATVTDPAGPTIAQFRSHVRELIERNAPPKAACDYCGSSGWKPVYKPVTEPGYEPDIAGVMPCHCEHGDSRRDAHTKAIEHNAYELDRLNPTRHLPIAPRRKDTAA